MLKFKKIRGNYIHSTAIINWNSLVIGKGNTIGPYVVIGNEAQWKGKKSVGKIIIGNNNVFNEYTNIHLPTKLKKIDPQENVPSEVDKIISEAEKMKATNTISVSKNLENFKFINFLFLSIITFTALILILDTFKFQINTALPGFNLLLDNFYESLKDIYLFFKDLIR